MLTAEGFDILLGRLIIPLGIVLVCEGSPGAREAELGVRVLRDLVADAGRALWATRPRAMSNPVIVGTASDVLASADLGVRDVGG